LIEKYLTENGKDPITGEELSMDDVVELKSESFIIIIHFVLLQI